MSRLVILAAALAAISLPLQAQTTRNTPRYDAISRNGAEVMREVMDRRATRISPQGQGFAFTAPVAGSRVDASVPLQVRGRVEGPGQVTLTMLWYWPKGESSSHYELSDEYYRYRTFEIQANADGTWQASDVVLDMPRRQNQEGQKLYLAATGWDGGGNPYPGKIESEHALYLPAVHLSPLREPLPRLPAKRLRPGDTQRLQPPVGQPVNRPRTSP